MNGFVPAALPSVGGRAVSRQSAHQLQPLPARQSLARRRSASRILRVSFLAKACSAWSEMLVATQAVAVSQGVEMAA